MGRTRGPQPVETMAEFQTRLGVAPERILMTPPPGTATEADLLEALKAGPRRFVELIDGVLVEKPVGSPQALVAAIIIRLLGNYVEARKLGVVLAPDGLFRLGKKLVRQPDVSFLTWVQWTPERRREPVTGVAPDLAIEVLTPSNTKREMARKIRALFFAGTRLVWLVYPETRTAEVYTAPDERRRIPKKGALTGDPVLPGYRLPLADIFAAGDEPETP